VNLGVAELFVLLFMLLGFGLFIVALVDLVKRPPDAWKAAGHNQLVWVLVVLIVGFVGPLLYLTIARPALEAAANQLESDESGR